MCNSTMIEIELENASDCDAAARCRDVPVQGESAAHSKAGTGGKGDQRAARKHLDLKEWIKDLRGSLMIMAQVVASVTYQSGMNPPGGFWQDDNGGHRAGLPVLADKDKRRYNLFFAANTGAFALSVSIILMLMGGNLLDTEAWAVTLTVSVLLDSLLMLTAYALGSSRDMGIVLLILVVPAIFFVFMVITAGGIRLLRRKTGSLLPCLRNRTQGAVR